MTGRRQHYIPQFLQQGFNSRGDGEAPRAWLYRKGVPAPVEASLKDIGVEKRTYCYTAPGVDISADKPMTQAEGSRLAPLVQKLRADTGHVTKKCDQARLAELFAHIHARTKAVWEIGKMQAPSLFERLGVFARDPKAIRDVLPRLMETQRHLFIRLLAPRYPDRDMEEFVSESVEQMRVASAEDLCSDIRPMLGGFLEWALQLLQASKVQSLRELSERPETAKRFQDCTFSVLEWTSARLVQGDTPVVFHKASGFAPLLAKDEPFEYAFLPITPTRVVVASTMGGMPESWEALRDASIACSYQHFIAAAPYSELGALATIFGSRFPAVTDTDIERLFTEAVELASTPGWMGPEVVAAAEHFVRQYLWAPQDGGVAAPGGEQ